VCTAAARNEKDKKKISIDRFICASGLDLCKVQSQILLLLFCCWLQTQLGPIVISIIARLFPSITTSETEEEEEEEEEAASHSLTD
jgi:hypothetical protein